MKYRSILAGLAMLVPAALVHTATAAPDGVGAPTSAAVEAVAIEPLYVTPPGEVSDQQVASMQRQLADWPELRRYRAENASLGPPPAGQARVVFFGDSITDSWGRIAGTRFFPGKPYVNRGISGQTTAQMVVRFRQDVIDLRPAAVVILAGTNDIAGNTGLSTLSMIQDNLRSMTELAQASGIRVILASLLPVSDYPWRPGLAPAGKVRKLNAWIREYAASQGATYLDYHAALSNGQGGMDRRLALDGVHPTPAGYAIMAPLAQHAIEQAARRQGLRRTPDP